MPIPLPIHRHTIEKSASFVQVTLPSNKNVFIILSFCLPLLVWGFMVFNILYFIGILYQTLDLAKNTTPEVQAGSTLIILGAFFLLIFLALLAFGAVVIYALLRVITGKEIIEANAKVLKVTRQILGWKRTQEYDASEVKDLRATEKQSNFSPNKRFKTLLGLNGMIAFDYGAKIFRFGLDIEEAEAKQIVLAIQEGLTQTNTG